MNKNELVEVFESAIENGDSYVSVYMEIEGMVGHEITTNQLVNLPDRLTYYVNTYDENLYHKYADKAIRIVDVVSHDSYIF